MNQYTSAIMGTALKNEILSSYFTDMVVEVKVSILASDVTNIHAKFEDTKRQDASVLVIHCFLQH